MATRTKKNGVAPVSTPEPSAAVPWPFAPKIQEFLTATRDAPAFRAVVDEFPTFDLSDVSEADPVARAIWQTRVEVEADATRDGVELDAAAAKRLVQDVTVAQAAQIAFLWLTETDPQRYSPGNAERIARRWAKEWTAATPTATRSRFNIVGADVVKAQKPPRALVTGILYEETIAELCGAAATFKSFQALAMAEAVASGSDWHGHATHKTSVLYVAGEGRGGQKQRIAALETHTGRACSVQFILEAVQVHQPSDVDALLSAIADLPEAPGLIFLDTLARCFVGADENSARDAGLFVAGLDRIRAATGAAIVVLHHENKNGSARGSSAFDGAFDTIIEAKRQDKIVTLGCRKQKDAEEFRPFSLALRVVELDEVDEHGAQLSSLIFEPTDAPPAIEKTGAAERNREQILAVLREQFPTGATSKDWLDAVETRGIVKRATFFAQRRELLESGCVTHNEKTGVNHPQNATETDI